MTNEYAWIADTYYSRGEFKQSLGHRLKQYEANYQIYLNDQANRSSQFRLASAEFALAKNYEKVNDCPSAAHWRERARSHAETIRIADPANQKWQALHTRITSEYGSC